MLGLSSNRQAHESSLEMVAMTSLVVCVLAIFLGIVGEAEVAVNERSGEYWGVQVETGA